MLLTSVLSLLGHALLVAALLMRPFHQRSWPRAWKAAVLVVVAAAVCAPYDSVPVVGYLRGAIGDLSVTTLLLLVASLFAFVTGRPLFPPHERHALLAAVAVAALLLYPFALGLTYFDSYSLGFGSTLMITALLLLTLIAWYAGLGLVVLCVVAACVTYMSGLLESNNLWDYLIDPLISVYALFVTVPWLMATIQWPKAGGTGDTR
ncbi:MAG: hypothetical protein A2140_03195 [Candidatus Muproteobacteria bacterium RBG_16_62_13]|uniref:Uncharacterized protein n=1 Tax=Candidatus Muproteobacteria bacterium RBG_16_62_13 TaxID=1817756 RepID=A0A1F6T1T5_9PROT|nr:MAG: hypothetical protein A2140_03195 [Candidatus Muproteobacteria bacterium RBG_16_62_13]